MRHRDKTTPVLALEDWKALRKKVLDLGGDNYDQPVLVKFLDSNTYEVMDRDIVEDEFYVLRRWKLIRELDPEGKDLEDAIRDARRHTGRKGGKRSRGGKGVKGGKKRRSGRRGRRSGKRDSRGRRKSGGGDKS